MVVSRFTQTGELLGREHAPLCDAERIANGFGLRRARKPSETQTALAVAVLGQLAEAQFRLGEGPGAGDGRHTKRYRRHRRDP